MSLLKGFTSLFDWMFPKSLEEQRAELDNKMQNLYDRMGWGLYKNPLHNSPITPINNSWSIATEITQKYEKDQTAVYTTSDEFLQEMIKLVPKEKFVPYSYYNKDRDAIQVYWSNDESYTQPTSNGINLKIAFNTHEIVGIDILNANQLVIQSRQPVSLDEQQRFAIWWCLDRIMRRYGDEPIIVNGININETIMKLTGRLFV